MEYSSLICVTVIRTINFGRPPTPEIERITVIRRVVSRAPNVCSGDKILTIVFIIFTVCICRCVSPSLITTTHVRSSYNFCSRFIIVNELNVYVDSACVLIIVIITIMNIFMLLFTMISFSALPPRTDVCP